MTTLLLTTIALLAQLPTPCEASSTPPASATLIVQAVDPLWLPLPGAQVRVSARGSEARIEHADKDGVARFTSPAGAYRIDVEMEGFKTKSVKSVRVSGKADGSAPNVQVQLSLKGSRTIID